MNNPYSYDDPEPEDEWQHGPYEDLGDEENEVWFVKILSWATAIADRVMDEALVEVYSDYSVPEGDKDYRACAAIRTAIIEGFIVRPELMEDVIGTSVIEEEYMEDGA